MPNTLQSDMEREERIRGAAMEYQPKREHFLAMAKFHTTAADALSKHGKTKDAAAALKLAERCRALADGTQRT